MCKLAVSLLEMDYRYLDAGLKEIEKAGADYVHIDMMDGNFVPSLGIGTRLIEGIRASAKLVFDVHMMVRDPERFLDRVARAGADVITIHYEACGNARETLERIHGLGLQAGIALNPETPVESLEEDILKLAEVVHVMTTHPGVEGQTFIPSSLGKIARLRARLRQLGLSSQIEVDGNITLENVQSAVQAGATVIVSGRALVQGNITENIRRMRDVLRETKKGEENEIRTGN